MFAILELNKYFCQMSTLRLLNDERYRDLCPSFMFLFAKTICEFKHLYCCYILHLIFRIKVAQFFLTKTDDQNK